MREPGQDAERVPVTAVRGAGGCGGGARASGLPLIEGPLTATAAATATATPIGEAEFAGLVAGMGPFGAGRQVAVAVSGGADSMALAWLLRRWGAPLAVVVDHGLRAESANEAAETVARLGRFGVAARCVRLELAGGAGLGARARAARYAALLAVCRETGRPDLFVGHHRHDQAETVMLRAARGSGPAGLSGMAAVAWWDDARVLRPLLSVHPGRLRATLAAAGVGWVEDPGNADPASARGGLRSRGVPDAPAIAAGQAGVRRAVAEGALARELGACVSVYPGGYAAVHGPMSVEAWAALVWTISGQAYPPSLAAVHRLAMAGAGTLHGVRVSRGWVTRERVAVAAAVPARLGTRWDERFVVRDGGDGSGRIGAVGRGQRGLRGRGVVPCLVQENLPALRFGTDLLVIPHLAYAPENACRTVQVEFRPTRPLAGSLFAPGQSAGPGIGGCTWGEGTPCRKSGGSVESDRAC